jgi:hypothetical protein
MLNRLGLPWSGKHKERKRGQIKNKQAFVFGTKGRHLLCGDSWPLQNPFAKHGCQESLLLDCPREMGIDAIQTIVYIPYQKVVLVMF